MSLPLLLLWWLCWHKVQKLMPLGAACLGCQQALLSQSVGKGALLLQLKSNRFLLRTAQFLLE